jgi:hypothetical protein
VIEIALRQRNPRRPNAGGPPTHPSLPSIFKGSPPHHFPRYPHLLGVRDLRGIEETSGAPSQAGAVQRVKDPPG